MRGPSGIILGLAIIFQSHMSSSDGALGTLGLLAVLALVVLNGFFVAAEFSLVAIRRSRVAELVNGGRRNAKALFVAIDHLEAYLAATQLGITIASLALGWIGEPALARLVEPVLHWMLSPFGAVVGAHTVAVVISFVGITALHIVLGELAPKSLALQRSEVTALWVVRPLSVLLFVFKPAIWALNAMGNLVLRLVGLHSGGTEETLYSSKELKLLVQESREAGILEPGQQEVVSRVLDIADRRVGEIMTPRPEIVWIDIQGPADAVLRTIRQCRHDQFLIAKGSLDRTQGIVLKRDLLDQILDGGAPDPLRAVREPLVMLEGTPVLQALEQFKRAPVRLAIVVDEYGSVLGVVTQTDLLGAIAGHLVEEGELPDITETGDGVLEIDGLTPIREVLQRLGMFEEEADLPGNVYTIAGFALVHLGHVPQVGASFLFNGWRFEIKAMERRRIARLVARRWPVSQRLTVAAAASESDPTVATRDGARRDH